MKFTILFLCCSLLQVNAFSSYGQNQKVTLKEKDVALAQIFQQIEYQTDLHFFYNSNELNIGERVSLNAKNTEIIDVLAQLFKNKTISYQLLGNQIVLKKNEVALTTSNTETIVQQRTIEGTVTDTKGMPLVGVTVIIEGTQKGVVTNFNGVYKITLEPENDVLVFSSLAYETERIVVGNQKVIYIILKDDFSQLDEVVLIGYGEQKRENVTGAVSSVKPDVIVQAATGSIGFDRALGGLVNGVQVSQGSGRPGSAVRLNIRGITSPLSSIGGTNQPLYVIDGVPFNIDGLQGANPLLTINPADIESFDVLKDAAATSIYGSRGANGVILINTSILPLLALDQICLHVMKMANYWDNLILLMVLSKP